MSYFIKHNPISGVWHLEDPGGAFATLIIGNQRALLVDTCLGIGDLYQTVREITPLPLTVVATHGHIDHIAGGYQFPKVLLPAKEFENAKRSLCQEMKENLLREQKRMGQIPYEEAALRSYQGENIVPLPLDSIIELGGVTVIPLSLPGHTAGSVGYYCPQHSLLIAGDCIAPLIALHYTDSVSLEAYTQLIQEIQSMWFRNVLCSHSAKILNLADLQAILDLCHQISANLVKQFLPYREYLIPKQIGKLYLSKATADGTSVGIVLK